MPAKMYPVLGLRSGVDVTFKVCTGCGEPRHVSAYSRDARGALGRRAQCRACQVAYQADYYAANRDRERAYRADYRAANREGIAEYKASYYAANPHVRWRADAAHRLRAHGFPEQAARALEQTWTKDDVIARWGSQCVYCGGPWEHLDHHVPLAAGGEHSLEACRPSCASCNIAKAAAEPADTETEGSQP